jgi:hypothetical protein
MAGRGGKKDETEQRMEVLRLVEEGVITPDEALELMEGLEEGEQIHRTSSPGVLDRITATFLKGSELAGDANRSEPFRAQRRQRLHILVNDGERNRVDVWLPVTLIDTGWNLVERFIPDAFDRRAANALRNALLHGSSGTIIDIKDGRQSIKVSLE